MLTEPYQTVTASSFFNVDRSTTFEIFSTFAAICKRSRRKLDCTSAALLRTKIKVSATENIVAEKKLSTSNICSYSYHILFNIFRLYSAGCYHEQVRWQTTQETQEKLRFECTCLPGISPCTPQRTGSVVKRRQNAALCIAML